MKALNKIKIEWSAEFAYVIGLIATDGNLAKDQRHMNLTSKDKQLADLFMKCLGIKTKVTMKGSGTVKEKKYYFVQFGDVNFYKFLLSIGLTPNKSKTLGSVEVPDRYFFDFLRGLFDGDGSFYSYWDPRWRSSFMFYSEFISASQKHILWLQEEIEKRVGIVGHITKGDTQGCYQLKYAKEESYKLLPNLYYRGRHLCLTRKYLKIKKALGIIGRSF